MVLAGGTLAACQLAVDLAGRGLAVIVTTSSSSLAPEISSTLRAWAASGASRGPLAPLLEAGPLPHLGRLTEGLENLLLDAGVRFYYRAWPAGIGLAGGGAAAVVLAGKFGVGLVAAPVIVDCTPQATLARAAGAPVVRRGAAGAPVAFTQVVQHLGDAATVPSSCSLRVSAVRGPFVEYRFETAAAPHDPLFAARAAVDARRALLAAGPDLPADPLRVADEATFDPLWRLERAGVEGLSILGPVAVSGDAEAAAMTREPLRVLPLAAEAAGALAAEARRRRGLADPAAPLQIKAGEPATREAPLRLHDPAFDEPGVAWRAAEMATPATLLSRPLLVCGCGTSGLAAAMAAARAGVATACVEASGDPGGVHTVGGVPDYWFGSWSTAMVRHHLALKRIAAERRVPWSVAQMALADEAGVELLPLTPLAGAVADGRSVRGAVVATPAGLGVIEAELLVDATGDADVAAWAGAPYSYGSERDEITMWFSFGKFRRDMPAASRLYFSVVDQRSLRDTTRAIVAARRQVGVFGEGEFPQFTVATRESRHIRGRARLAYAGMLSGRRFPDAVAVVRSNVDIKGLASSDLAMSGFVERDFLRNWTATIPYGALVPEGLDNLIVTGKAYSASHDALAMARMQADMTDLGAAAGLAAVLAARAAGGFPGVDPLELQASLRAAGLPPPGEAEPPASDELESLVDRAVMGPLELDGQAKLLSGGGEAARLMREGLPASRASSRSLLARMLASLGDPAGSEVLLAEVEAALSAPELPRLWAREHHHLPDHGWAPEPVYAINALALAGERRLVPLLVRLVDRLPIDEHLTDYRFCYVHAVAYALERLALPEGIPPLVRLLGEPALSNRRLARDADPRRGADHVAERCAYLELALSRALARCGDPRGYDRLASCLEDQRLYLCRSARLELRELTGEDLGFDAAAWRAWLAENPQPQPRPFHRRLD